MVVIQNHRFLDQIMVVVVVELLQLESTRMGSTGSWAGNGGAGATTKMYLMELQLLAYAGGGGGGDSWTWRCWRSRWRRWW
jgi:hypothetical protein